MMKKCTTTASPYVPNIKALPFALGLALLSICFTGHAQTSEPNRIVKSGNEIELAKDAPDRHVVVKRDTLWDISAKFLASPWKWPEVWQMNKDQIRNPHLIYPGDIVYLDRSGATPRLRLGKPLPTTDASFGPTKAEPLVRSEPIDRAPIPTISAQAIEAFLNRPLIVEENTLAKSPRVIAVADSRVYSGQGDRLYVRGLPEGAEVGSDWHIYRSAKPLLDPDTRKPLAYEAIFVGSGKLEKLGDIATVRLTGTQEEIGDGDRLMPAERARSFNYSPKPPDQTINGKILSVYRGVSQAGKNSVISVSAGKANGLDVGSVVAIRQIGRQVTDRQTNEKLRLPDEAIGHVLIFRVFDKISYGLIMDTKGYPVIGDKITNP